MSVFIAMSIYALSMSISPGPVNLITFSTGMNHGFRHAFPFVSGATIGFTLLLMALGLGLDAVAMQHRLFLDVLGICGALFIIYMGFSIATTSTTVNVERNEILGFIQGFLLQWLNPKAWIACLAGISAFNISNASSTLAQFVLIYFSICYVSIASWAIVGDRISQWINSSSILKYFNRLMGGLLMLVAVYLLLVQTGIIQVVG